MSLEAASLTGLEGRVAFVTDAATGIGRSVALALAAAGVHVSVNSREAHRGEEIAAEAKLLGVRAASVQADLTQSDTVEAVLEEAEEGIGPIDVVVHCSDVRPHHLVVETSVDEWRHVLESNCSSFFYVAQQLLPGMMERGFGRLIAVNVAAADRARRQHAAVSTARAALTALVKVIAVESGAHGVTANVVSPAITEDGSVDQRSPDLLRDLLAIPRPAMLDEIAFACLYLASQQAGYVTGQSLYVDGGLLI